MARTKKRNRQKQTQNITTLVKGRHKIKLGKFTADKICLKEACINDVVLRIRIEGLNSKGKRKDSAVPKAPDTKYALRPPFVLMKPLQKSIEFSKNKVLQYKNGLITKKPEEKVVKRYYLQFQRLKYNYHSKIVNFDKLSEKVCTMKLPTKSWKVTVIMNSSMITMYSFTNHNPVRSVSFSENNPYFKIVIDGKPVVLLGCPKTVASIRDMEVLLDIVHNLSLRDCMVATV